MSAGRSGILTVALLGLCIGGSSCTDSKRELSSPPTRAEPPLARKASPPARPKDKPATLGDRLTAGMKLMNEGKLEVIDEICSQDFVDHNPLPGTSADFAGLKDFVTQVRAAFPDIKTTAEDILVELQDSMSPVEVGDAELRAGLAEVRAPLSGLVASAERFASLFGR